MPGEHPCAVEDCTAAAKPNQLMCLPCWKRTPQALQRAVNSTWRNYRRDPEAYLVARGKAIAWHREQSGAQGSLL